MSWWNASRRWALCGAMAGWLAAGCEGAAEPLEPAPVSPAPVAASGQRQGTETERLVLEEQARLLQVEREQAQLAAELERRREVTRERQDFILGWQRRVRESKASQPPGSPALNALYDDLSGSLRSARLELARALDVSDVPLVPTAGADPLAGLSVDGGAAGVQAVRLRVEAETQRINVLAARTASEERAELAQEVDTLNRERLGLLGFLSHAKRESIMGFTPQGFDQAASEIQLSWLVASYHRRTFQEQLPRFGEDGLERRTVGEIALVSGELLLVLGLFFAGRRLARALISAKLNQICERNRRLRVSRYSRGERSLELLAGVQQRLEWLVLSLVLFAFLPAALGAVRGVQLLHTVFTWVLGGGLVVSLVNALADGSRRTRDDDARALRVRSLRLVGGVVIFFGLTLTLSARQLGQGTIHSWLSWLARFSAVPVFLLLVSWWQHQVFQRIAEQAEKTALERWILRERPIVQRFLAAMAGSIILFAGGSLRATRRWMVSFDLTRRGLAYLFRRELGKLGPDRGAEATLVALDDATYERLGPAAPSALHISTELDQPLSLRAKAIRAERGGLLALVSERGMGRTTLLRRLKEVVGEGPARVESCGLDDATAPLASLLGSLRSRLALPASATLEEVATSLDGAGGPVAFLVDDAQRLIRPVIGGLKDFDAVVEAARRHSRRCTWVFAFNDALWPFLQRSRGVCPLFDDVLRIPAWREPEIAQLIQTRSAEANLEVSFEHLLDELVKPADESVHQAALAERASGYYRLIWDNAVGNPGIALDIWRRALGVDGERRTFVRPPPSMDTGALERLPDPAAFVLRAVLQMAPASPLEIERATLLSGDEVGDALRYSLNHGFVYQDRERYQVSWTWLRPISRFLHRKHLLVAS